MSNFTHRTSESLPSNFQCLMTLTNCLFSPQKSRFLSVNMALYSTLKLLYQICNSPCCQSYNSYDVTLENLALDQLIILKLIFFFILITYLVDIVEIL